jgi:hypothetical protein
VLSTTLRAVPWPTPAARRAGAQTFTPTATKAGDSVSGKLAAKYNFLPWLESELTFGTSGSVEATIEAADALTAGLTLTAECEHAPGKAGLLQAGNLIAEYKQEAFACKTSYDYYKGDLLCAPPRAPTGDHPRDRAAPRRATPCHRAPPLPMRAPTDCRLGKHDVW